MASKDDSGYTAGRENGELLLAVRKDAMGTLASADAFLTPLQVDGSGALVVSGAGGGSTTITSVIPGTAATNLGKAEDGAHTSADVGVMALAVRTDSPANRSGTDGDYEPLQLSAGRLWVSSSVTAIVPGTGATNLGKAEDGAHTTADVGVMGLAVRTDTPANRSDTDGDYEPLQVSGGRLWTSSTLTTETTGAIAATGSNRDVDTAAEVMTASSIAAVKGVVVKADAANTGIVYVGKDNTVTAGTTDATDGFPLAAGDSVTLPINNANLVWLIASAANQVVYFMAI